MPGTSSSLYFRGVTNLQSTLDLLFAQYSLGKATQMIVTGGSAGGLSTFLHVDAVAARLGPAVRTVGKPVCGFFLDHGNDGNQPPNVTYTLEMK